MAGIAHHDVAKILAEILSTHLEYHKTLPSLDPATSLLTSKVTEVINNELDRFPEHVRDLVVQYLDEKYPDLA